MHGVYFDTRGTGLTANALALPLVIPSGRQSIKATVEKDPMIAEFVRILIVDDVEADAELVRFELQRMPFAHQTTWVKDRESFVRELADPPDIILTDFSMARFDAIELLKIVRTSQPDVPVIIVSGAIGEESAVQAMKLGAVDYVSKDRLGRLETAIEHVLNVRRLNRAKREAETAHRELVAIIDSTPDLVGISDHKGQLVYLNPAGKALLGLTLGTTRPLPDITELGDTWDGGKSIATVLEVAANKGVWRGAGTLRVDRGREITALLTLLCHKDADEAVVRFSITARDITEQQAAAEKLQQSETLLHMASRIGRMGAWMIDVPEMTVTWSREVNAILDVVPGYVPAIETAVNFYVPGDRELIRKAIDSCLENGTPFDLELQIVTAGERRIWVRSFGEAGRDARGVIRRVQGALQDITDQKKSAEQMKLLASQLTTTFESITDAFFTLDADWRCTYINREAERILQKTRAEMVGRDIWCTFPDARGTTFEREYRRAVEAQITAVFEEYYPPLNLWLEVRAYPSIQGLAVYFTDIGERRRLEEERAAALARERAAREEAEAAKAHFRKLFEFLPGLYVVLTPEDFRIVAVSDGFLHVTRRTREEITGRSLFEVFPDDPKEPDASGSRNLRASLERVKRSGRADSMPLQRYPVPRPESEGGGFEERFWSPFNSPVFGPGGELAYIINRSEEVTEFVRLRQRAGARKNGQRTLETKLERMEAELVVRATDVMKLSEQLQIREEQFRGMFVNAATGIATMNAKQQFLQANPVFCAIIGYTEEELRSMEFGSLSVKEDRPQHDRALNGLLTYQTGTTRIEARYVTKTGAVIWINGNLSAVRASKDNPLYFIVVLQDITWRKEAEFALQQREQHYRLLFSRNPQPMWVFDRETKRFLAVNLAAIEKYGYTEEEFLTMSIEDMRPPEEIPNLHASFLLLTLGSKNVGMWRHRTKSGQIIDVEVFADEIEFADRPARLILSNDVTERLRAQSQIAEQAALIDQANDAIIVRDMDDVIRFWSKGAERLYGWTAAEAIGRSNRELMGGPSEKLAESIRALQETGDWTGERESVTKDGRNVVVATRWSLLRHESGQPRAVLAIQSDVTENKKIQAQFLRAQRLESIGTLAGGIAHDLNNLLSPIIMGMGLLKMGSISPEDRGIIDTVESSAERGTQLVKQVLSFARGVEGLRVTLNVAQLINEVELIIANTFPKNITLKINIPSDVGLIVGDPTQLNQVLLNLCVNARDAMPSGGQLKLAARNEEFDEQYVATHPGMVQGRYVVIEVADSGIGIPKEIIDRIFEPFFTTKELGKGTGLGLSTTLGIVRSHGGLVNVQSEPGKGSTFRIHLPLQSQKKYVAVTQTENRPLPRGNGQWILFVDDEASIRTITQHTLEAFGYRVITAEDGAAAISLFVANRHKIALLITDLMMPVMDGHVLIAAIRHLDEQLPVIASSGLQAHDDSAKMMSVRVRHFIAKPYSTETLLRTVETALGPGTAGNETTSSLNPTLTS